MRFHKILIALTAFIFFTACGGDDTPNRTVNSNTANAANVNAAPANEDNPVATKTPPPAETVNTAETVRPVVMAYYEALKSKDDAALRKVYARETLASLEKDAAAEGKKSLVEFITEVEPVPAKPFEVRNEVVQGDTAIAEIISDSYPNGIKIKFIKEGGEWKMTNESPEFPKK